MLYNLNDHLFEDSGIAGQEFKARFPRTLSHATGEDHGLRLRELWISAGGNADRGRKGRGIQDVFRLRRASFSFRSTSTTSLAAPLITMA